MDLSGLVTSFFQTATDKGIMEWLEEEYIEGGIFSHLILMVLIVGLAFLMRRWSMRKERSN